MEVVLIVHGGAGTISPSNYDSKLDVLKAAVVQGYEVLRRSDSSVDAVEAAVRVMEDREECNAGYGSVLTKTGEVEMDALIIRGADLKAGAVGAVKHVKNPVTLAKVIMERTNHVMLVGEGAEEFAKTQGLEMLDNESLVAPRSRRILELVLSKAIAATTETGVSITKSEGEDTSQTQVAAQTDDDVSLLSLDKLKIPNEGGTVGAVAINSKGEIAAATSTGGMTAKLPGRVGDTPIIGGGTFCDDTICGISATGFGESIMKVCLASKIAALIENGMNASEAVLTALTKMSERIGEGDGGAIVVTKDGEVGFNFNSKNMGWAFIKGNQLQSGILKDQISVQEYTYQPSN